MVDEGSIWSPIPLGFSPGNLSMTGELEFEFPLEKSSQSMVLIPYLSGSGIRNKVAEPAKLFHQQQCSGHPFVFHLIV